jgi:RES domain-containing protein
MIVYRIGLAKYAKDLSGEGARLNGGRWNHVLTPCLYYSESRALAVLEYTVNSNLYNIPRALTITSMLIPDQLIQTLDLAYLPGNWNELPAPTSTKTFGTELLEEGLRLAYKIPSTVMPDEFNIIVNPLHESMNQCKIITVKDFIYDVRIKLK